jgi:phage terminase large subunit GpA-like protein
VDGAKESLYSRLRLETPGPGYQHFPSNPKCRYDEEYFRQLTSEVLRTSSSGQIHFQKLSGEARNESLDCRIYATGAVEILKPDWAQVKASLEVKAENDWREKEQKRHDLLIAPIPDLRNADVPAPPDLDLSALASRINQGSRKWMNIT